MRKFLVVLDDSRECLNAMRFAAMRAHNTGGGVQILAVIPPEEFQHWIGVGDLMREEVRERIEARDSHGGSRGGCHYRRRSSGHGCRRFCGRLLGKCACCCICYQN